MSDSWEADARAEYTRRQLAAFDSLPRRLRKLVTLASHSVDCELIASRLASGISPETIAQILLKYKEPKS